MSKFVTRRTIHCGYTSPHTFFQQKYRPNCEKGASLFLLIFVRLIYHVCPCVCKRHRPHLCQNYRHDNQSKYETTELVPAKKTIAAQSPRAGRSLESGLPCGGRDVTAEGRLEPVFNACCRSTVPLNYHSIQCYYRNIQR